MTRFRSTEGVPLMAWVISCLPFRRVDTAGLRNGILAFMPNNLHCSFCSQPEHLTGPLLAKMDAGHKRHPVRICKRCAELAIDTIDREVLRRAGERPRLRVF